MSTQHSGDFFGEIGKTPTYSIFCDFPCRTCSGTDPSFCHICPPSHHEVFTGGTNDYILYVSTGERLDACPAHTYLTISPPTCVDCDVTCDECEADPLYCTKCYPGKYLYNNGCISPPCPLGYVENDDLWMCIRIFHSHTSINLGDPRELAMNSTYLFSLRPTSNLPSDAVFRVEIPPELNLYETSPGVCDSNKGTCSIVETDIAEITGVLSSPYVDLSTFITFTLGIGNPKLPIKVADLSLKVQSKSSDLLSVYHQSVIALTSNTINEFYFRHNLVDVSITGGSANTVTNTTYTFKFKNLDYPIPAGSNIDILFPYSMQFLSPTPLITNLKNFTGTPIPSRDEFHLYLINGYETDLPSNCEIEFTINGILTPYLLGITPPFEIYISSGLDYTYRLFGLKNPMSINIITISEFPSLSISPNSLITNDLVNYEFILDTGDGKINSSHWITLSTKTSCDHNTLVPSGFSISTSLTDGMWNYTMKISSIINEHSNIKFNVTCRNPPTTRPNSGFVLSAWHSPDDSVHNIFYQKTESIPDMNILNTFVYVTLSLSNYYAKVENNITIDIESITSCNELDQISHFL